MKAFHFYLLGVLWLADMVTLAVIGPIGRHALAFPVLYCMGHILMILLVLKFPSDLANWKSFALVISLGITARLIFLPYPVGNDVFRYVWEGCIQNLGFNPFIHSPLSPALAEVARGELYPIWQKINHPEFSAAYPPVTLLLFRLFAWLNPDPFFFKSVMVGFDIGVMIVLMLMIKQRGVLPSRLLLYAANPLLIIYISGEGHLDVIQVFFLCLALYFVLCKKSPSTGFMILGLATLSKYFAVVAFPFLVNQENRKKSLAVLIPFILCIPYVDAGSGFFQSLGEFGSHFHYNDFLTVLIRYLFRDHYIIISIGLLGICLAWVYLFVQDQMRSVYLALGCLLVLLPTLHPWYLVLIAPFLVFFPSRAWLYLQAAMVFTFPVSAVEFYTGVFEEIPFLKLFEYVPFYGLLLYGLFKGGFLFREKSYAKPMSISAVIPTLNESSSLVQCLQSLKNRTALNEIIVADGGSIDGTPALAGKYGVRVVKSPQGRGLQIRRGVESASGDVIVILHADCTAQKGVFRMILERLEAESDTVGGAVGMQFEGNNLKTKAIAFLNNLRALLTGISFGDQAQFFRTKALDAAGGFPTMMLMEDVELSLRLKEIGRLLFLPSGILVSERRWLGKNFAGNLMTVFHLFPRYLIERRFSRRNALKRNYYEIYYSDRENHIRN